MFGQTSYTLIVYAPKIIFLGQRKFPIYIASQNDMVPYRAPKDKISQFSTGFVFCYLSSTTLHCQMAAQKTIIPLFHMYSSSNTSFAQTIFFNNKQFFTVIFFTNILQQRQRDAGLDACAATISVLTGCQKLYAYGLRFIGPFRNSKDHRACK